MKRFEFKLQAVLTLRQRAEQTELEKYSRAIQTRQAAAERLAESEMELSEGRRLWLNALADGCPAVRAAQMLGFCHLLEERKRQCEQALNLADIELNHASQRMLLARQEREAVEKFLSRQRERYDRQLRDEEQKMIDDLINRRLPLSFSSGSSASSPSPGGSSAGENLWN
jgi:flagellar protein FliJ